MQIQTWHPPLRHCIRAKYYVKSGLTNVLKNANKTKNMHLFSIRIANYKSSLLFVQNTKQSSKNRFQFSLILFQILFQFQSKVFLLGKPEPV